MILVKNAMKEEPDKQCDVKWSETEDCIAYVSYLPPGKRSTTIAYRVDTRDQEIHVHVVSLANHMRRPSQKVRDDIQSWAWIDGDFVPLSVAITYLAQSLPKLGAKRAVELEWMGRRCQKEVLRQVVHFIYLMAWDEGKKTRQMWEKEGGPCLPN